MKCIIIEDEKSGQELIKLKLFKFFPEIEILSIIETQSDAIEFLNNPNVKIDFIFLDIEIKGGNGLTVLENVKKINFEIIFITAYEQYALNAFKHGAIHYLLKPFKDIDFINAVERIKLKKNVLNNVEKTISIIHKNKTVLINFDEICYLKSDGSYTSIFTNKSTYTSSKSIGEYEKLLNKSKFFRVHHSYIINKLHIQKFERERNGIIHLSNNHFVPVSQRKILEFMKFIE